MPKTKKKLLTRKNLLKLKSFAVGVGNYSRAVSNSLDETFAIPKREGYTLVKRR